jgi:hypothetical protein
VDLPQIRVAFFDLGDTLVVAATRSWVPGARDALLALAAAGLRLGVISNTGTLRHDQLTPLLPADFDWTVFAPELVILSAEVGVEKPDPEIFRRAVAATGGSAGACLFCTESLPDALVAQRVGLLSARVQPPPNADVAGLAAALVVAGALPHRSSRLFVSVPSVTHFTRIERLSMTMHKGPKAPKAKSTNGKDGLAPRPEQVASALALLERVFKQRGAGGISSVLPRRTGAAPAPAEVGTQIRVWEDDPFLTAVAGSDPVPAEPIEEDVPTNDHELLQTKIDGDQPDPGQFDPGTTEFLFWNATAALDRGINFWAPLLPDGTQWSCVPHPMTVNLDAGVDLNAFYARDNGLNFFHDTVAGVTAFSGESPDVVCHELGHAILDAFKPELFDAMSTEVGAFHEAFGDMSSMLSALQIPTMRAYVLDHTGGHLNVNSRLSQLARELGWAIRQLAPDAVDSDCLRNTANSFFYVDPSTLPPSAPASQLSSEVHSFSRVFSGAFLDVLAGMFTIGPAGSHADDSDKLLAVSQDAGRLLVEGIRVAAVGSGFYSHVAAGMIQADQSLFGGRYRNALTSTFVQRGILAPASAVALSRDLQASAGRAFGVSSAPRAKHLQFEGDNEGYKKTGSSLPVLPLRPLMTRIGVTVHVHMATEPSRFGAAPAALTGGTAPSTSAEEDARSFVEDLIQQGRIDHTGAPDVIPVELIPVVPADPSDKTHHLVKEDGKVVLKRRHFCCGFCRSRGCR